MPSAAEEIFEFAKTDKGCTCQVKNCRNPRLKARRICSKHKQQLYRHRHPRRAAWNSLRDSARRKGIEFSLTQEEFNSLVEATGYMEGKGRTPSSLHMDRVDPNKGYQLDNLKVITCSQNSRKGSYERWITLPTGERIRLYEIGIGQDAADNDWLPFPEPGEELDFDQPDSNDIDDNEPF